MFKIFVCASSYHQNFLFLLEVIHKYDSQFSLCSHDLPFFLVPVGNDSGDKCWMSEQEDCKGSSRYKELYIITKTIETNAQGHLYYYYYFYTLNRNTFTES